MVEPIPPLPERPAITPFDLGVAFRHRWSRYLTVIEVLKKYEARGQKNVAPDQLGVMEQSPIPPPIKRPIKRPAWAIEGPYFPTLGGVGA